MVVPFLATVLVVKAAAVVVCSCGNCGGVFLIVVEIAAYSVLTFLVIVVAKVVALLMCGGGYRSGVYGGGDHTRISRLVFAENGVAGQCRSGNNGRGDGGGSSQ